jgi:hypothetical protein
VTFAGGGATFGSNIVLENNDYISNPSDYTVRIMPEGTNATDYGLEFEFSDWGYGSVITNRRASDGANAGNIRFDSAVVINNDTDLTMGGNSHSRIRWSSEGNNTLQIGVRASDSIDNCSGALALIHSGHMGVANRSPGVTHTNPNLYVYSYSSGADKYIRFEHDGTDANIVTGAGDISLQPASGVVEIIAGITASGGVTFAGNVTASTFVGALTGNVTGNASGSAATATTAAVATTVTITDNENENESNALIFTAGGDIDGGNLGLESDGTLTYNPSTGKVTATGFVGALTGNASGSAATVTAGEQSAITEVGILSELTMGGELSCGDNEITRPKLKDYAETVNAVGSVNSSTAFSFANGNVQTVTVSGMSTGSNIEFSISNPPASGIAGTMTVIFTNGNAHGDHSFHSSIKWPGDNAPTLSASGVDIISFTTIDAGTTYYGFVGGINFS